MSTPHRITVCSLPEYDQLVAEIYLEGRFVGLLSQEAGPDKTMLEIPTRDRDETIKIDLAAFEAALSEAKRRLSHLDKPT
jgi:hypothetical protein